MNLEKFLPWLLIILVIAGAIEMEMSAPSLVSIGQYFNAPEKIVGLTITVNLFAFFLMSFIYGPLSDIYDRKKILIFGNVVGSIGAVLCAFAPSMPILLLARLIQGLGVSASLIITPAVIADNYTHEKVDRLYKINTGVLTVFSAASPILGGFINHNFGWRGNYGIVAIIQLIALILLIFFYKENKVREKIESSLSEKFTNIFKSYKTALSNLNFMLTAIVPSLLYASYVSFTTYSAFLYIEVFKLDDVQYSIHQAIIVAGFSFTCLLLGLLKYDHQKWRKPNILLGLVCIIIGSFGVMFSSSLNPTTFYMVLVAIGNAFLMLSIYVVAMMILDAKGTASSVVVTLRTFITFLSTWLVASMYDGSNIRIGLFMTSAAGLVTLIIVYLLCYTKTFSNPCDKTI